MIEPAMFIIENGKVYMVVATPGRDLYVTSEGFIGERYNEFGQWCGK